MFFQIFLDIVPRHHYFVNVFTVKLLVCCFQCESQKRDQPGVLAVSRLFEENHLIFYQTPLGSHSVEQTPLEI